MPPILIDLARLDHKAYRTLSAVPQTRVSVAMPASRPRAITAAVPPAAELTLVAIGASAGGLDAVKGLLAALPPARGLAFILVQHLDPRHASLLVELLSGKSALTVEQVVDGVRIAAGHLYVIAPGTYLTVGGGTLNASPPEEARGARMPFDVLLRSVAAQYGARGIGVVLSGTGTDGTLGLSALRNAGGRTIAQDPAEAEYAGMPQSAIDAGVIDDVLKLADMPARLTLVEAGSRAPPPAAATPWLAEIVDLLRAKTTHDFRAYKPGTIERRVERRMLGCGVPLGDHARYLAKLQGDAAERDALADDILINVTSFFRDAAVFDLLARTTISEMVRAHEHETPLRVWTAGCSTGEETYSLAILFKEAIAAAGRNFRVQMFATDVDADAVATARKGLYPAEIAADVSAERLNKFFVREDAGWCVSADLRACVVFAVHDVLTDAPFSRLDFISCRNLLIYLRPPAQTKLIALLHFALKEGGLLLLGGAETAGEIEGRFEIVAKAERLYRHIGRHRPSGFSQAVAVPDPARATWPTAAEPARTSGLPDLVRRLVLDTFAPAAVLVNAARESVYALGATAKYLSVAPGVPTHDVLAMAAPALRGRLKSAIDRAFATRTRVEIAGGEREPGKPATAFRLVLQPASDGDTELVLIGFVDAPERARAATPSPGADDAGELETARAERDAAHAERDAADDARKIAAEEASSVSEEYQSTNEELLTSKEELQSLNEELTALNAQLQETLDTQRTLSADLQNILYSTDVATIFLDPDLNIRFFTPATKALFNVIPGDIGRPLADLASLASDRTLSSDMHAVLSGERARECDIKTDDKIWNRRAVPYRAHDGAVAGVVITFTDVTERRHVKRALEDARRVADQANAAKSRFLAAASHDLRQPLQTLTLVQGLLAKSISGERAERLVRRLDETLGAMTGMLNTLLDINQIEAGTLKVDVADFALGDLLGRLRDEFAYHAAAKRLELRVVTTALHVRSDPRLLEQMIRNLVSNALKYTRAGKVLIGCRRHGNCLRIEIWDTGIGIPEAELGQIFDEYHQLDNAARERNRGLGLGLAIVQRLGDMLGHPVAVRSNPGRGSVFSIEAGLAAAQALIAPPAKVSDHARGAILIVEDDPEVRELLELLLGEEGHTSIVAANGPTALALVAGGARPDLILSDYNLPGGLDGVGTIARLRDTLGPATPAIVLTGDISTATLKRIARGDYVQLNKPVKPAELLVTIARLLAGPPVVAAPDPTGPVVYVIDDDRAVRETLREALETAGHAVEDYASGEGFLQAFRPGRDACLLLDAYLPGMSGLDLLHRLGTAGHHVPAIMITGHSDVAMAVEAMKAGALDFVEKPIGVPDLLIAVARALEGAADAGKHASWRADAASHLETLTDRQREVMALVLAGHPSKNIAADLGISQRTVENHRASIMTKTGAKSLPALARLAMIAAEAA